MSRKGCDIMKVEVKFFATFREIFNANEIEIELESASNIQELLCLLCDSRKRRQEIFDPSGELRPSVMILKNGRHVQSLDGVQTSLEAGDTIAMFPPLGGG